MKTAFILLAQYSGAAIIPLSQVCSDYFTHLTPEKLQRKVHAGEIDLPIVRIEQSQKSAKGVHLQDLADYIDRRRSEALKELQKFAPISAGRPDVSPAEAKSQRPKPQKPAAP
ncbi:pyocin activator PrtN family protein [Pseudomonas sp. BMS12]|uniref:pyocin activator PrtN family protein n=1 Tax=Pseudomonas sp. BMS12 TaxID=1796033 RepID=UPI0009EE3A88|nr:pyocin activator PrtN family protein [Pseudomonas sp. BMS12]